MLAEMCADILVVGAGHAGLEAACSAAQLGIRVILATLPGTPIASAPCNPAIGGVGKGQVVREIDALGGAMGKLADLSAIQCRTLNASRGHAVQSTRFQIDKDYYSKVAENYIGTFPNIHVIRDTVKKTVSYTHLTLPTKRIV